jgi:hypothetical protein
MEQKAYAIRLLTSVFLVLATLGFGSVADSAQNYEGVSVYTRYNIHVQKLVTNRGTKVQASYANYTDPGPVHVIIPAGSLIRIEKVSRKRIEFVWPDQNLEVQFEYHQPRMGMDPSTYLDKITSPTPVSYAKLSKLDRKGIAEGKAFVGMTRQGIMAALGYPAAHRTPSLEASTYVYWTNRFGTLAVEFDDKGYVKRVSN